MLCIWPQWENARPAIFFHPIDPVVRGFHRVFIDSMVLLDGIFVPPSASRLLLEQCRRQGQRLAISSSTRSEVERKLADLAPCPLSHKFLSVFAVDANLNSLGIDIIEVERTGEENPLKDHDSHHWEDIKQGTILVSNDGRLVDDLRSNGKVAYSVLEFFEYVLGHRPWSYFANIEPRPDRGFVYSIVSLPTSGGSGTVFSLGGNLALSYNDRNNTWQVSSSVGGISLKIKTPKPRNEEFFKVLVTWDRRGMWLFDSRVHDPSFFRFTTSWQPSFSEAACSIGHDDGKDFFTGSIRSVTTGDQKVGTSLWRRNPLEQDYPPLPTDSNRLRECVGLVCVLLRLCDSYTVSIE